MADICVPQIQACRMRFARLGDDGNPEAGAENLYVTKSFSRFAVTAVYTDGDEIEDKNACGEVEVNFKSADSFKRADFEITLMVPDPYITALLTGGNVLVDGDAVGASYPAIGAIDEFNRWSIELWSKRVRNGALDPDFPYARWVAPMAQNIRVGDKAFESGTQLTVISGQMVENPTWSDGPVNDWPVNADRVLQWLPVTDLPDVVCGPIELVAS